MEEAQIRVQDIASIIKKKWLIVLAVSLFVSTIVSIFNYFMITPQYVASTKLFISKEYKDGSYSTDLGMYQKLLKTYSEIILTNDFVERAIESDDLDVSAGEILGRLSVTPSTNTQILYLQYTSNDKFLAKDIVNVVTDEFIKEANEYMPDSRVKVLERVQLPKYPMSHNKFKNIMVGFVGGAILGIVLLVFLEYIDDTFKSKSEFERITGIEVIGVLGAKE